MAPKRQLSGDGATPPDHLRCKRTDGRRWRCSALAAEGTSSGYCAHHHSLISRRRKCTTLQVSPVRPSCSGSGQRSGRSESVRSTPTPPLKTASLREITRRQDVTSGAAVPDKLRCRHNDADNGRCPARAVPNLDLCSYHHSLVGESLGSEEPSKARRKRRARKLVSDERLVAALLHVSEKRERRRMGSRVDVLPDDDEIRKDLPNGTMTVASAAILASNGRPAILSPKIGFEDTPVPALRCFRSKNADPIPVGPVKILPLSVGSHKGVKAICHRCGESRTGRLVLCQSCDEQFFCFHCIKKWIA